MPATPALLLEQCARRQGWSFSTLWLGSGSTNRQSHDNIAAPPPSCCNMYTLTLSAYCLAVAAAAGRTHSVDMLRGQMQGTRKGAPGSAAQHSTAQQKGCTKVASPRRTMGCARSCKHSSAAWPTLVMKCRGAPAAGDVEVCTHAVWTGRPHQLPQGYELDHGTLLAQDRGHSEQQGTRSWDISARLRRVWPPCCGTCRQPRLASSQLPGHVVACHSPVHTYIYAHMPAGRTCAIPGACHPEGQLVQPKGLLVGLCPAPDCISAHQPA
jgi:hypothetical protein